jgi:hypothetical protein
MRSQNTQLSGYCGETLSPMANGRMTIALSQADVDVMVSEETPKKMPASDDTKPTISSLSPKLQMRIGEFHQKIAQALCEILNRNIFGEIAAGNAINCKRQYTQWRGGMTRSLAQGVRVASLDNALPLA